MTVETIALAAVPAPVEAGAWGAGPGAASQADTALFAAMMQHQGTAAVAGASAPAQVSAVSATSGGGLGDKILGSLDAAGRSYAENDFQLRDALFSADGHIGAREMLQVQFHMIHSSLAAELVGKGISKTVQNVDQLTKLQ